MEPGVCIRLWNEGQTRGRMAHDAPEILSSDLARLVLDLAQWGVSDPGALSWLDLPSKAGWTEAVKSLQSMGALDTSQHLTEHGRSIVKLPVSPNLAHMILQAKIIDQGALAGQIAVILSENYQGRQTDLRDRLRRLGSDKSPRGRQLRELAVRLGGKGRVQALEAGRILAFAFPDRIAQARGQHGRFVLANGRGGQLDNHDPMSGETWLTIASLAGRAAQAHITLAAPLLISEILDDHGDLLTQEDVLETDKSKGKPRAFRVKRLGRLIIEKQHIAKPDPALLERALVNHIRDNGFSCLPLNDAGRLLRSRIVFLRQKTSDDSWPDLSDENLIEDLDNWLLPYLAGKTSISTIEAGDITNAIKDLIGRNRLKDLEQQMPSHFVAPTGSRAAIDYDPERGAVVSIRVQELFGLGIHPHVCNGTEPVLFELLSPARRPIQMTRDLPGFWSGSWKDVKADMKGRYPRHPWPDDPANSDPTRRVKPRK